MSSFNTSLRTESSKADDTFISTIALGILELQSLFSVSSALWFAVIIISSPLFHREDYKPKKGKQAKTINQKGYQKRFFGSYLVNAYYSKHLFQPLLVKPSQEELTTTPVGLNPGETKFVKDLENFLLGTTLQNKSVFLLRNLTRGKGVGFFEVNSFYPDFIMWIKDQTKQKIVFVDPKGISRYSLENRKLNLHKYLKQEIQPKINRTDVELDAYILSVTPYETFVRTLPLKKTIEQMADENHLLFLKRTQARANPEYMNTLFKLLGC